MFAWRCLVSDAKGAGRRFFRIPMQLTGRELGRERSRGNRERERHSLSHPGSGLLSSLAVQKNQRAARRKMMMRLIKSEAFEQARDRV
jgi:hypothetical protein